MQTSFSSDLIDDKITIEAYECRNRELFTELLHSPFAKLIAYHTPQEPVLPVTGKIARACHGWSTGEKSACVKTPRDQGIWRAQELFHMTEGESKARKDYMFYNTKAKTMDGSNIGTALRFFFIGEYEKLLYDMNTGYHAADILGRDVGKTRLEGEESAGKHEKRPEWEKKPSIEHGQASCASPETVGYAESVLPTDPNLDLT